MRPTAAVRRGALAALQARDVWALYGRVEQAVNYAAGARGGEALAPLAARVKSAQEAMKDAADVRDAEDACDELRALASAEIEEACAAGARDAAMLISALARRRRSQKEEKDAAMLEIRAGAGGSEASLFAKELVGMYERLALRKGWRWRVLALHTTPVGGLRDFAARVGGEAYGVLSAEAGVHRVQRVPTTESGGRVHTSTATVSVLRAGKKVNTKAIPTSDVRIDVYRASGAGGQHVNTTESAVRVTHIPTGIVATSQDERSQHRNRATALQSLAERVCARLEKDEADARSDEKRRQMGACLSGGERADRIRTYNFPQNRVTDHRIVPCDVLIDFLPSLPHIVGNKNAVLSSVVKGDVDLDRLMNSVQTVIELQTVSDLVVAVQRDGETALVDS